MGNRSMFVGLDVHKETIDVSIAEGDRQGEVRHYGVIASDLEPLDKVVRALRAPEPDVAFRVRSRPVRVWDLSPPDRPRRRLRGGQSVDDSEAQRGSGENRSARQSDARAAASRRRTARDLRPG